MTPARNLPVLVILLIPGLFSSCDKNEPGIVSGPYLEKGLYGDNLLFPGKTEYSNREISMQCNNENVVTITITSRDIRRKPIINATPDGIWFHDPSTNRNWSVGGFSINDCKQFFTSTPGVNCDLMLEFDTGTYLIEYDVSGRSAPELTKTITVKY